MNTACVGGARGAVFVTPGAPAAACGGIANASLLPEAPAIDIGDALTVLMQLSAKLNEVQTKSQMQQAEMAGNARKAASEQRKELLRQAAEAARKAAEEQEGSLFSFIAEKVVAVGLTVAATIASGGLAAPAVVALVGVGISTAAEIGERTGLLREAFGDAASDVATGAKWLGVGLSVGAGVFSLCSGASLTKAVGEAKKGATVLQRANTVADATHAVFQGVRDARAAKLRKESELMEVDAREQQHMIEFLERVIEAVIEDLEASQESAKKASEICQSMRQTHDQTILLAANLKG